MSFEVNLGIAIGEYMARKERDEREVLFNRIVKTAAEGLLTAPEETISNEIRVLTSMIKRMSDEFKLDLMASINLELENNETATPRTIPKEALAMRNLLM